MQLSVDVCSPASLAHSLGETRAAENIRRNTTNEHKDKINYSMGWLALFFFYFFFGLVRFNVEAIHLTFNLLKKNHMAYSPTWCVPFRLPIYIFFLSLLIVLL